MSEDIVFDTALPEERAELCALWQESFGDGKRQIMEFYDSFPCIGNVFVARYSGRIACVINAVPMQFRANGKMNEAAYLYAITTRREMRGRGIFRSLYAYTKNKLTERGCKLLFLCAASDALADMYAKMGFRGGISRIDQNILTEECSPRESYMRYRRLALARDGVLLPDMPFFLWGMKSAREAGRSDFSHRTMHSFTNEDFNIPFYAAMLADEA